MSPFIELVIFFIICVLSWGAAGVLIFLVVCAGYLGLLALFGRFESRPGKKEP